VLNWTAKHEVFPHGLTALQQELEWPIVAHNRWLSNATNYATRNGGAFEFVYDDEHAAAMPQDDAFCQCHSEPTRGEWVRQPTPFVATTHV